jgi:hypothetical protein
MRNDIHPVCDPNTGGDDRPGLSHWSHYFLKTVVRLTDAQVAEFKNSDGSTDQMIRDIYVAGYEDGRAAQRHWDQTIIKMVAGDRRISDK